MGCMSTSIRDKLVNGSSTNIIEHHLHLLSFGSKVTVSISPELFVRSIVGTKVSSQTGYLWIHLVTYLAPESLSGDNYKLFQHI